MRANPSGEAGIQFLSNDRIEVYHYQNSSYVVQVVTERVFRDPSAWFHLVVVYDSDQSTAADRLAIYINGVKETQFNTSTYPSQGYESYLNSSTSHAIFGSDLFPAGYLAEVHFVDGAALAATDFGETRSSDGVWVPKEYTGSHTTTGSTSGTLPNYNSNTSLPTYSDQDNNDGTPSVYQMENAFDGNSSTYANMTYANGKWTRANFAQAITNVTRIDVGWDGEGDVGYNGSVVNSSVGYNGSRQSLTLYNNSGSPITLNNIHMVTQAGNGVCRLYDITITTTTQSATELTFSSVPDGPNGFHLNFSDSSTNEALGFDSAPTTPDPDPKKGFDVVLYSGNNGTQNVGGALFEPGLVWVKGRSEVMQHRLVDVVRGNNKQLKSNSTAAQNTFDGLSINPDGFTVKNDANETKQKRYKLCCLDVASWRACCS